MTFPKAAKANLVEPCLPTKLPQCTPTVSSLCHRRPLIITPSLPPPLRHRPLHLHLGRQFPPCSLPQLDPTFLESHLHLRRRTPATTLTPSPAACPQERHDEPSTRHVPPRSPAASLIPTLRGARHATHTTANQNHHRPQPRRPRNRDVTTKCKASNDSA